ncbi:hypothetical protein E2C01_059154 [Portunus trituberculatus]|uniref:Uncharacterized protein n=1 Tax=Portunus trituberculatus TaxID=210409 RepID=A0A5B7H5B3_PORTR|nr:hypothetical protein [Portunus trituberculatus]
MLLLRCLALHAHSSLSSSCVICLSPLLLSRTFRISFTFFSLLMAVSSFLPSITSLLFTPAAASPLAPWPPSFTSSSPPPTAHTPSARVITIMFSVTLQDT